MNHLNKLSLSQASDFLSVCLSLFLLLSPFAVWPEKKEGIKNLWSTGLFDSYIEPDASVLFEFMHLMSSLIHFEGVAISRVTNFQISRVKHGTFIRSFLQAFFHMFDHLMTNVNILKSDAKQ